MKSNKITINGISVTEYEPAVSTKKTILFFHGTGGATQDEGLKSYCKTHDVGAWTYCPSYSGGWVNLSSMIAFVDYICEKHGIESIDLMTGLSAGGNCVYKYLTQTKSGHNRVKYFAPTSINSMSFVSQISACAAHPLTHYHGENDSSPNALSETDDFILAYNKAYLGKAKRIVFDGKGHNVWDIVYASVLTAPTVPGTPDLYSPFDQSLYDWSNITGTTEPPVEPPIEPPVETIFLDMTKVTVENGKAVAMGSDGKSYSWDIGIV
jgi:predicted esterase